MSHEGPDIFKYLCYRTYLKDKISALQQINSKFSQRWIAKKAGWKSPALLSMILSNQRKLSLTNARLLSYALELDEREERYFLLLVELALVENTEDYEDMLQKIKAEFQSGIFAHITGESAELLKYWYILAIRNYLPIADDNQNIDAMAKALGLKASEVEEGIRILAKHQRIKKNNKGQWEKSEPSIRAEDYVAPMIMANFHLQMIQRSIQAMALPREKRHFEALTLSLPANRFEEFREKVKTLICEMDMAAEAYPRKSGLYQLNIQFFSLLQDLDQENLQSYKEQNQ